MLDFRLCLVTDRRICMNGSLESCVRDACHAGIKAIQLREKDLPGAALLELAKQLKLVTNAEGAALFVNDRLDIALCAGADGFHAPEDGFPIATARSLSGKALVLGKSVHSLSAARAAESEGVTYITFGPIFSTPSKTKFGDPQGLPALRAVARAVNVPVVAVGGITPQNAPQCIDHGAAAVAVISEILASTDVARAVDRFRESLGEL